MSVIFRYLLCRYLYLLFFFTISLIVSLFILRLKEIAEFISSSLEWDLIVRFIIYQLFYILPLILPLSSFFSSKFLFQKLSENQEILALRSAGSSIKRIAYPIVCVGLMVSLVNFMLLAEICPRCRLLTQKLIYDISTKNPFYVLYKNAQASYPSIYVDMIPGEKGENVKDLTLVFYQYPDQWNLIYAKEVETKKDHLKGLNVAILSSISSHLPENFDHLLLENQQTVDLESSFISQFLKKGPLKLHYDYFRIKDLMIEVFFFRPSQSRFIYAIELCRRLSLSISPIFFTILGMSSSLYTQRISFAKNPSFGAFLSILIYFLGFLGAKSIKTSYLFLLILCFVPLIWISVFSFKNFYCLNKGKV